MSSTTLDIPGVYLQRRPRVSPPPRIRTDIAGFVGFEPRMWPIEARIDTVRDRHVVTVHVEPFQLAIGERTAQIDVPERTLRLHGAAGQALDDGDSAVLTIVAALDDQATFRRDDQDPPRARIEVVAGAPSPVAPIAPTDEALRGAMAAGPPPGGRAPAWVRLADVEARRAGDIVWATVVPRLAPTVCNDWDDYRVRCGEAGGGTQLATAVRAFFANGGGRCVVTTVRRPFDVDLEALQIALAEMVGDRTLPVDRATGVARLQLTDVVSLVACPDLHAGRTERTVRERPIPPDEDAAGFVPCDDEPPSPPAPAIGVEASDVPLYPDPDDVYETQRAMLETAAGGPNPVHVFFTPPRTLDPERSEYRHPDAADAIAWRRRFAEDPRLDGERSDAPPAFGAAFWPWLRHAVDVGVDPVVAPPLGVAVGLAAAEDLERGPFTSPANRIARGVVGLASPVSDDDVRRLYEPALDGAVGRRGAVNVFRPTRTRGIELWGSRTLSADRWFRHLSIRRGLSAIERRARVALRELVFEPNSPMLQLQATQLLLNILLDAQEAGALRGRRPEESFVVRCDDALNTPDDIAGGRLLCEVGVALAAPAEFIWFRLGRTGDAIEVSEVAVP